MVLAMLQGALCFGPKTHNRHYILQLLCFAVWGPILYYFGASLTVRVAIDTYEARPLQFDQHKPSPTFIAD